MTTRLQAAIRAKYGTSERAMAALGLPVSLLRATDTARPSADHRPRAGRAYGRDQEADLGEALESRRPIPDQDPTFTECKELCLRFLKGRLSDEDLQKAKALLDGDEMVTDEVEEAEREREATPAMDGRGGVSRRAHRLTQRIGLL